MRRVLLFCLALMCAECLMAQDIYFQAWRYEDGDQFCGEGEPEGILVLSKHNDLNFSVTNITDKRRMHVTPRGIGLDGNYQYVIIVDRESPDKPNGELKIEVNRQGDIHSATFTVRPRANQLLAFKAEEPEAPITLENLTSQTDFAKDFSVGIVEIRSSIPNLQVVASPKLGARRDSKQNASDKSITIIIYTIPIKTLNDARERAERLVKERDELDRRLTNVGAGQTSTASEAEWQRLDALSKEADQAEADLAEMQSITIYADKTNRLEISLENMSANRKFVYGVRPLKETTETFYNECSGFINEGDNAFRQRQYDQARTAFQNALSAKDAQPHQKQAANERIAICDECQEYERRAMNAFAKIREMRKTGGSQEEVVEYAKAGINYLDKANLLNEQQFYKDRIAQLEQLINDQPLQIGLTFAKWLSSDDGLFESGTLENVEVWAFFGQTAPVPNDYKSDKKFKDLTGNSNDYRQVGVSDRSGQVSLEFERTNLPKGFLFRPRGYGDKVKIQYLDTNDLIKNAEGSYNKRRFRVRMFATL